jgi:drug/metabolite transporter (DMT)-like permease
LIGYDKAVNGPQRIVLALAIAGLLAATLRATEQTFMTLDALALTAIIGWTAYTVFRKENWQREARRAARGRARGVCHCGYNLTGNESGTCPECGQRIG